MKKILVPIDFSRTSLNAAYFACKIAQKNDSHLIFLHAYRVPLDNAFVPATLINHMAFEREQQATQEFRDYMIKYLKTQLANTELPPMKFELQYGFATDIIHERAIHYDTNLIIMGTNGADSVWDKMIGSITSNVIKYSQVPVLAVPVNAQYNDFERIVYATNFDEKDIEIIKRVGEFAKLFDAQVGLLHIAPQNDEQDWYEASLLGDDLDSENMGDIPIYNIESNSVIEGLENFIKNNQFDLLAVLTHSKNFFENLLQGSMTKRLALKTSIPILAYH